jgi:hypothetical protein
MAAETLLRRCDSEAGVVSLDVRDEASKERRCGRRCIAQAAHTLKMVRKRDVKKRLNGFSLPIVGGGAQWETIESSRTSAHRVLSFLADRRVLFNPYWREQAGECVESVLAVRRMLSEEIGNLHADDPLVQHLDAMRAACRRFLDRVRAKSGDQDRRLWAPYREIDHDDVLLVMGLGELRAVMGVQIGLIAAAFDLDVPDTLIEILPPPPDDGTDIDFDLRRRH